MNKTASLLITLLLLLPVAGVNAQDTAKVMCYNLEEYDPASTVRTVYFKKILDDIKPDILVVEEITSQVTVDIFLNDVLKPTGVNYKSGTFKPSPVYYYLDTTSNAVFYNADKFDFNDNTQISTTKRDINAFTLTNKKTNRRIILFGVHLDAGTQNSDIFNRTDQASNLRDYTKNLPAGTDYMVLGDFNTYTGSEGAIQNLLDNSTPGYFVDPINQIGDWNKNPIYASIHTQATRATSGGMDDRFDMILVSPGLMNEGGVTYINNSYTAYGNDGQHFNLSINGAPANTAVSGTIADALFFASDHLPVYALFKFESTTGVEESKNTLPGTFSLGQNYPNPFNPSTVISYNLPTGENVRLELYNALGQKLQTLINEKQSAGIHSFNFVPKNLVSGVYLYRLTAGQASITKKMILMK